jgi:hypothetical protein
VKPARGDPASLPAELEEFVQALAELLAEDYLRRERQPPAVDQREGEAGARDK